MDDCKLIALSMIGAGLVGISAPVFALSSTNYGIGEYSLPNGSGSLSSGNYQLEGTLGPLLGTLASSSYGLDVGFPSETGGTLTLTLNENAVSLGRVNPNSSTTATSSATVTTDGPGYSLALTKTELLTHTDASTTISDFTGSIATPATWSGTGFGFTVSDGTDVAAKWSSGTKYAAIPTGTLTTAHSVTSSLSAGDTTTFTYRVDTTATEQAGTYSTTLGFSATVLP